MRNSHVVGILIFLLVLENNLPLKYLGFLLSFIVLLIFILKGKVQFSKSKFQSLSLLYTPFFYCILLSLSCVSMHYMVLFTLIIKLLVGYIIFLLFSIDNIAKGIKFAILSHCGIFLIHIFFLTLGQGELFNHIVGFEAQTSFGGSSYIPFRATGFFDEPSLFGMTMLCLMLSFFLLKNKFFLTSIPFLSFSFPTMLVAMTFTLNKLIRLNAFLRVLFFLLAICVLGGLILFAKDRESNVKDSPIGLRTTHLIFLAQSPNLIQGSGFCSAYGQFPLDLGRDDLRSNGLGNFKDAGQIIYSSDRIGLLGMFIMCLCFLSFLGRKRFLFFIVYFGLSKVPFIAMSTVILFSSVSSYRQIPSKY